MQARHLSIQAQHALTEAKKEGKCISLELNQQKIIALEAQQAERMSFQRLAALMENEEYQTALAIVKALPANTRDMRVLGGQDQQDRGQHPSSFDLREPC
jgi:hypothetical protein